MDAVLFEYEDCDTLTVEVWDRNDFVEGKWSEMLVINLTLWDTGGGWVMMDKNKVIKLRDVLDKWLKEQGDE